MAVRKVLTVTVLIFSCVLPTVVGISSYTKYESADHGHIRYENGTLQWGDFPTSMNSSGQQTESRSSAWDTTVDFAVAVVDSVQTRGFPYDLLRRIIRGDYSEEEVRRYQTNVIVVTAIGALLAAAILVTLGVYLLVKWRRGHKDAFLLYIPPLSPSRVKVIVGVGAVFMALDLAFVLWAVVASGYAMSGALKLDDIVNDAMDDVTNYFDGLEQQHEFITAMTSKWLIQDVILNDLKDIGVLLWETGRDEFLNETNVNSSFQAVADFDTKAAEALSLLSTLVANMSSTLSGVGGELDSVLTAVHYNLTAAVNDYTCFGCGGSCSGCSAIVPDDVYLNADFNVLPDITSNVASLQSLLSTPVAGSSSSPEYFFTYGIGDIITQSGNVTLARDGLTADLLSYENTWGNATSNALYPNSSTFWFDTLRPRWTSFYEEMEAKEIARFTFILLFSLLTIATMAVTIYTIVIIGQRGVFKELAGNDLTFPRKLMGWCIVCEVTLASCYLAMAAAGFYTGANLQKAVCDPGEKWGVVNQVIDFPDAIPGHPGYYLSSVLLGNGSLGPIKMADVLTACDNGSNAYSLFFPNLLMPNLQQDLQNYSQHFTGYEALFDLMRVNLDGVSLVPPDFQTWLANFSSATSFNYTKYTDVLNGNIINADVNAYAANLQTVHDTAWPDGPLDPSKSRLSIAADLLLGQKANINALDLIKNNLAAVFANFASTVNNTETTANKTMDDLRALEPALHAMAAAAISRGVDQYQSEFFYLLDQAANQTWQWMGEAGICTQVRDAYDTVISGFCDNYADYQNASWLLLGHTCLFLLIWTSLCFVLYRGLPEHVDSETDDDGFQRVVGVSQSEQSKARALFIENKPRSEVGSLVPVIFTSAEATEESLSDGSWSERGTGKSDSQATVRAVKLDLESVDSDQQTPARPKASYVTDAPRRSSHGQVATASRTSSGGASSGGYGRSSHDQSASQDALRRPSHGRVAALIGSKSTPSNVSKRSGQGQVAPDTGVSREEEKRSSAASRGGATLDLTVESLDY